MKQREKEERVKQITIRMKEVESMITIITDKLNKEQDQIQRELLNTEMELTMRKNVILQHLLTETISCPGPFEDVLVAYHKKLDVYEKESNENLSKRLKIVADRMQEEKVRVMQVDREDSTSQEAWTPVEIQREVLNSENTHMEEANHMEELTHMEEPKEEDQPADTPSST